MYCKRWGAIRGTDLEWNLNQAKISFSSHNANSFCSELRLPGLRLSVRHLHNKSAQCVMLTFTGPYQHCSKVTQVSQTYFVTFRQICKPTSHHPLKLHVKDRRIQDVATVWIISELLKRQRQWKCCLLHWYFFLLQSYRQRVTVDVVDPGVVLRCLRSPEEGERVDETGWPLHCFDRHRVHWLAAGHCTLIHLGSFWLPDEGDAQDVMWLHHVRFI